MMTDTLPPWRPKQSTLRKINSSDFRVRYKALRYAASNFTKRKDVAEYISYKYGNRCYLCGKECGLEIDHIISVYTFARDRIDISGFNAEENLALICRSRNSRKAP